MNINELIKKGESEKVEFKKSLAETREILETISAFANSGGGRIFVGIEENKDGSVKEVFGIEVKGKVIENLGNEVRQNTDPVIYPSIELKEIEGKSVLVIEIKESPAKPVFAKLNKIPVAFKRVGKMNLKIDSNELRRIISEGKEFQWNSQICEGASLEDIDWGKVGWFKSLYKYITGKEILTEDRMLLENFKCLEKDSVKNSGILLFGEKPHKFILNNRITVVRYPEDEISDTYLDIKDFYGCLFDLIDNTDKYIREHMQIASKLTSGQIHRDEIPQYPLFAIRELIVNSVAHRDYSIAGSRIIIKMFKNRIEYHSPGGFPPGITPENIVDMQCSRNPAIVDVLSKVKYIESIGDGIDRVFNSVKNHPLNPELPLFREVGNSVIVTLYGADMDKLERIKSERKLNEKEMQIVGYIEEKGSITSGNVQRMFNVSRDTSSKYLNQLIKIGIIRRHGQGKFTYYTLK